MGRFTFFRHFLMDPRGVGSVLPSSAALARAMTTGIDFEHDFIVELGCGTGAVTDHIANSIRHPENYLGFEIQQGLHDKLRLRYGHLRIIADNATELDRYLEPRSHPINAVVSSLPFTSLDPRISKAVIDKYTKALAPGGIFRLFLYAHTFRLPRNQRFIHELSQLLSPPTTTLVFQNIPPARVLTFRKPALAIQSKE